MDSILDQRRSKYPINYMWMTLLFSLTLAQQERNLKMLSKCVEFASSLVVNWEKVRFIGVGLDPRRSLPLPSLWDVN